MTDPERDGDDTDAVDEADAPVSIDDGAVIEAAGDGEAGLDEDLDGDLDDEIDEDEDEAASAEGDSEDDAIAAHAHSDRAAAANDDAPAEALEADAAASPAAAIENGAPDEHGAGVDNGASVEAGEAGEGAPEAAVVAPFVAEEWVFGAIEALAFTSTEPVTAARAREIIAWEQKEMDGTEGRAEPTLSDIKGVFTTLTERWSDPTRSVAHGFRLVFVDGGLAFRTTAANARFIRRMQQGRPQRLSRAALETLSVVAYRQPVTKPQVEEIRGVDCSGALKALLDKKLVRILGKAEDVGRPLLYGTTKTFLDFFGLASLTDLPTLKELHELENGGPQEVPPPGEEQRPAIVMDLFNPDVVGAVSKETEQESQDALSALEEALGEAKKVAKQASSLVFGLEVQDEDDKAPPSGDAG